MVILGFDIGAALVPDVSLLETVVRGVVVYLSIFVLLRVILRGRTSAVTVSDLLVLVLIADAAQNAMASDYLSITTGIAFRFESMRRFVHPEHKPLVIDGRVLRKTLNDELITEGELLTQLRLNGVEEVTEVKAAYLEGNGEISVIKRSDGSGQATGSKAPAPAG